MKVVDKWFSEYSNRIIIETVINETKHTFEISLYFDRAKMKIAVTSIGVKKGREKKVKFLSCSDDYSYRSLDGEDRIVYERNFYKSHVPSEVLNLALKEYKDSIELDLF